MSCRITSVTLYLSENEAKNLPNGDVHLAQIPDFEMDISRTIWRIEVSNGSFFFTFFTVFHLSLTFFFYWRFPLNRLWGISQSKTSPTSVLQEYPSEYMPNSSWLSGDNTPETSLNLALSACKQLLFCIVPSP